MTTTVKSKDSSPKGFFRSRIMLALFLILFTVVLAPSCTSALPEKDIARFHKRQFGDITTAPAQNQTSTSTDASTSTSTSSSITATTSTVNVTTTITSTTTSARPTTTLTNSTITLTATNTSTTAATATPTESSPGSNNGPLIIGGAAVGGLVFAIGIAIIAFRCTINRRERQRRNKEMAATLAESFDRDPMASPRKGYMELGDGPATPGSTRGGSNLSRQGSQDAYFASHKEGQEYYNPHYVQERYGAANVGNYGMYEETELSVIGGSNGRSSPYMHNDHPMGYPPSSMGSSHYNNGYNQGGYYAGGH